MVDFQFFLVRFSANHVSRNRVLLFHGSRKILYHGFTVDFSPNHVSRNRFFAVSRITEDIHITDSRTKIVNSRIHGKFTEEKWLITVSRNALPPLRNVKIIVKL